MMMSVLGCARPPQKNRHFLLGFTVRAATGRGLAGLGGSSRGAQRIRPPRRAQWGQPAQTSSVDLVGGCALVSERIEFWCERFPVRCGQQEQGRWGEEAALPVGDVHGPGAVVSRS